MEQLCHRDSLNTCGAFSAATLSDSSALNVVTCKTSIMFSSCSGERNRCSSLKTLTTNYSRTNVTSGDREKEVEVVKRKLTLNLFFFFYSFESPTEAGGISDVCVYG